MIVDFEMLFVVGKQVGTTLFLRKEVMVIQDLLGFAPVSYLWLQEGCALVAEAFNLSLMTLADLALLCEVNGDHELLG